MKKNLRIITIDGQKSIGKTSQSWLLFKYFNDYEDLYRCHIFKMGGDLESSIYRATQILETLEKDGDALIICDGSIADLIQSDIQKGLRITEIQEKYRDLLHEYEKIHHKYGMANFLLTIDDNSECQKRLDIKNKISGLDRELIDSDYQKQISDGLSRFDNYVFTRNIGFIEVKTTKEDTILDINRTLLKLIHSEFKTKIPLKRGTF